MLVDEIKTKYPIHYLVWNNEFNELEKELKLKIHDLELKDPRKRTPLMLAVKLCHENCVKFLLSHKSDACVELDGWNVAQESVCTGNPDILTSVISVRDLQRQKHRSLQVPGLLNKLQKSPDFYVEMKWEFNSWIPLMSRVCPSDTYKVYKRGSNVRIDTTLLGFGFENKSWQRGNRSYVFKGEKDQAIMYEFDHDEKEYSMEIMKDFDTDLLENGIPPTKESVMMRLQSPVISNSIDIDKISFERNKSGWFGWKNEKNETINNYYCRVYNATNVEFITRTRTEHLSEQQVRMKHSRNPLQHFLGLAEEDYDTNARNVMLEAPTLEEYFSDIDLNGREVGKAKKMQTKVQKFKANLWLSDEFPIKLQEQILPILDLMSTLASPHVSKLKDFITMQLPSGFPVKIEIPLFHVLNALITFGNVFSLDNPVKYVSNIKEEDNDRLTCVIDDECFEVPANYKNRSGEYRRQVGFEDEDELMQMAIQQSLMQGNEPQYENDEVDIWEALRGQRPITPNNYMLENEDAQLQRALQESLMMSCAKIPSSETNSESISRRSPDMDDNLELALRLSRAEKLKENELLMEENKMIEMAIAMSLQEGHN
ncbi:unnamed protein product [Diamesa tonsa]